MAKRARILATVLHLSLLEQVGSLLSKVPEDEFGEHLSEWEISYPVVTNENGEFVSNDLNLASIGVHRHRGHRRRRNVELYSNKTYDFSDAEQSHHVYFNLTALGKNLHFKLQLAEGLLHPEATVIEYGEDNKKTEYPIDEELANCFLKGSINGLDNSLAHMSVCGGLTGIVSVDGDHFFIEPVETENKMEHKTETCSLS